MSNFTLFFAKHPALFFGLLLTLGVGIAIYPQAAIFLVFIFFFPKWEFLKMATVIVISFLYATYFKVPEYETYEQATFTITDIRTVTTPFSKSHIALGKIRAHGKRSANASMLLSKKLPLTNVLHFEKVTRNKTHLLRAPFSEGKNTPASLALQRYQVKKWVLSYIKKWYPNHLSQNFLQTIFTGLSVSTIIDEHFARCGLSHILAVSGFHFTMFLGVLFWGTRKYFGLKKGAVICAVAATLLQVYYGQTASVLRAYEMSLFLFFAYLFERIPKALNLLGLALIFSLLIDPFSITRLGFQLSFSATLGLLLVYPALQEVASSYFPTMHKIVIQHTSLKEKLRYFFSRLFLSISLLTLAASLTTMPILLAAFHHYPLSTFFYNLFMPPLLALAMLLFLISILIPPLHILNGWYLSLVLTPIIYQPKWTMGFISLSLHPLLATTLLIGIFIAALNVSANKAAIQY